MTIRIFIVIMNKIFIGAPNIMKKVTTASNSYAVPVCHL